MGMKQPDTEAVTGCYSCHQKLDGPASKLPGDYDEIFERAKALTHEYFKAKGLMK